ncbi:Gldg family protein [Flagellimonas baculiformis]|uniref:Gldg family protein n=1 Tax=Flagellimonas baculiformis TaxID=3067310 RepID=UPI00296E688E|nr:Gldg family protein [Muricauda sp. D6]
MKKIIKIAKLELGLLFYSPIAWLTLVIFMVQCGLTFTNLLDAKETSQQLGTNLNDLTVGVFGGHNGFFSAIQNKLYLYIPLLTMGLLSRELSSGSIKLLFSSPVTSKQIVLGKFLSMMAYGLLLVAVLLLMVFVASFSIEQLDFKFLAGGILGLYILICAYASIGLFMSSVTPYQVVAAIGTLAILAVLNFVGTIGQSVDVVRDITYWLSISGRADNFINGLISSKDFIYFLLVIFLFLTLTVMRLNKGRKTTSSATVTLKYMGLIVGVITLGYVSSLPLVDAYYDTTRFKKMTLTDKSKEIIGQLDGDLTITTYVNIINSFAHLGSPKFRIFDKSKFDQYTRFLPNLNMDYVMYFDSTFTKRDFQYNSLEEMAQRSATAYGIDFEKVLRPEEIRRKIDLSSERNAFVRKVIYKDRSSSLRMFFDMITYPGESEISAAIKRLLVPPPVIGVLRGNGERSMSKSGDSDYEDLIHNLTFRNSLINQGFDVVEIENRPDIMIPDSLVALVIADPIVPYSVEQQGKIQDYINNGGNLLIAGEPKKSHLLQPILNVLGIKFSPAQLTQQSEDLELHVLKAVLGPETDQIGIQLKRDTIITHAGAMGLETMEKSEFTIVPLTIAKAQKAYAKKDTIPFDKGNLYSYNLNTAHKGRITGNAPISKVKGKNAIDVGTPDHDFKVFFGQEEEVPISMALSRDINGKEQKIIVSGDADFLSNAELSRFNLRTGNFSLGTQIFKWFANGEFPVDITRPEAIDNTITVDQKDLSWIKIVLMGILPLLIAVSGATILMKRKRK